MEAKTGIANLKSSVFSPSGFSDLEVNQSLIGRIANLEDTTIHTQAERTATMLKVKNPFSVASKIRDTLGVPVVRFGSQPMMLTTDSTFAKTHKFFCLILLVFVGR